MMASWEEHARKFLLEEEKEDDELFFILLALCRYIIWKPTCFYLSLFLLPHFFHD